MNSRQKRVGVKAHSHSTDDFDEPIKVELFAVLDSYFLAIVVKAILPRDDNPVRFSFPRLGFTVHLNFAKGAIGALEENTIPTAEGFSFLNGKEATCHDWPINSPGVFPIIPKSYGSHLLRSLLASKMLPAMNSR